VQIELAPPPSPPTGIPTEAYANLSGATNRLVTDMLPTGAWMIDELNGLIYRAAKRDVDPSTPAEAVLTLDQEVDSTLLDDDGNLIVDAPELIRTVWVFPPAVERERAADGPLFIGGQPVARIDVRTRSFSP
jgi:hypothetical protein